MNNREIQTTAYIFRNRSFALKDWKTKTAFKSGSK